MCSEELNRIRKKSDRSDQHFLTEDFKLQIQFRECKPHGSTGINGVGGFSLDRWRRQACSITTTEQSKSF